MGRAGDGQEKEERKKEERKKEAAVPASYKFRDRGRTGDEVF